MDVGEEREGKGCQAHSLWELFNSIQFKVKLFPKLPLLQNMLWKIVGNLGSCFHL